MSDSTTNIDQISVSQASKEVTANQDFAADWPAFAFGRHDSASALLTWAYYGGNMYLNDSPRTLTRVNNGTIALTASATNYLYLSGLGVVTKTTSIPSGWPGPLASGNVALYTVVVGTSAPTSWTDHRIASGVTGTGGGTGGGTVPTGTGFTHITGGVQDGAAVAVDLSTAHATGILAAARFPALTGDITTSSGAVATTLANTITAGGPIGDGTHVAQITYDAKGRLTTVASVLITGAAPSGTAGGDLAGSYPNPTIKTSVSLTTPNINVATATSVNKVAITAPATSATLTVADGKTLTASNTLTLAGTDATTMTFPPASASVGYLNIPQNSKSAAYTTVLADSGKHIYHPASDANARTFTIDSNANVAYAIGTAITFVNRTTQVVSIAITSDTMTLGGTTTTGARSLAQNGVATAIKVETTEWVITGTGLS